MRTAIGHLHWVLAGVVLLAIARPAIGRWPVVVFRPYYAPYPPVVVFGYRPYAAVVVPALPVVPWPPRVYDYRGLDPVWAGVYGGTYGGAYRMVPRAIQPPAEALPLSPSLPEMVPTPQPSRTGPREF